MAASTTEIANMSIGHLGTGKLIGNLETEKSAEAVVVRRFYDIALAKLHRDFAWPHTTSFVTLGLVESDPNDEWGFSYRYPSDCVDFRRILSGSRNDSRQTRVPYRLGVDSQGRLIFCDTENAQGEYTALVTNPLLFPPDFTFSLSLLIASMIAPSLTAGDPFKMGMRAMQLYEIEIARAKANALNEEQIDEEVDSEFIRERN